MDIPPKEPASDLAHTGKVTWIRLGNASMRLGRSFEGHQFHCWPEFLTEPPEAVSMQLSEATEWGVLV